MVSPPSSRCSSSGHWKQSPVIHKDLCSLRFCSLPAQSWLIPLQPVENLTGPWTVCLLLPRSLCNLLLWRAMGLSSVQTAPPPGSLSCLLWLRSYSGFPHPDHTSSSGPCCPLHHMRVYPSVPEEKRSHGKDSVWCTWKVSRMQPRWNHGASWRPQVSEVNSCLLKEQIVGM